ncbi:MAG: hydrogenase maturation protease [Acidobacteriota bacterium]
MAEKPVLVLALGNDLIADDGLGPAAAALLAPHLSPQVELKTSAAAGMELLEELVGFEAAIIIDAVKTGAAPAGTIFRYRLEDLSPVAAPSAHWAGLPEAQAVAHHLGLPFPREVVIFAVEAQDLTTIGHPLSPPVQQSLPALVKQVLRELGSSGVRLGPSAKSDGSRLCGSAGGEVFNGFPRRA